MKKDLKINEDEFFSKVKRYKTEIDTSRTEFMDRKLQFLNQWDNFVDYDHEPIIKGQPYYHMPVIFEKLMAFHARVYKTIFSVDPFFSTIPLTKVSRDEAETTKQLLRWYMRDELNQGDGIKPVIDELIWDMGTDGFGFIWKTWITKYKKLPRDNDDMKKVRDKILSGGSGVIKRGKKSKILSGKSDPDREVVIDFDGLNYETVPQERVYMPEYNPTSSNMRHPKMILIEFYQTEDDLLSDKASGVFDGDAVDEVIKTGMGYPDFYKKELDYERKKNVGLYTAGGQKDDPSGKEPYTLHAILCHEDFDGDGIYEDYLVIASLKSGKILKACYLEEFAPSGNRPIYKFDLIKRPRSAYSRGFVEITNSISDEIDAFHNIRRVNGLIANVPWGFYRGGSGLEKEPIEVMPGKFYPVDDPQSDVRPMQFTNTTAWAMQEEQLANSYADRITSMPQYQSGTVPSNVGPLRSTSGLLTLLNEASAPLDVFIDRMRGPFNRLLSDSLADLQKRLPKIIEFRITGEGDQSIFSPEGEMQMMTINKQKILGKYKISLAVNNAQYNPEKERQNALAQAQLLTNQIALTLGIVTPQNLYNAYKKILKTGDEYNYDDYITDPQMIMRPLTLDQEYLSAIQGKMPVIVMNDPEHQQKIEGLLALVATPEFAEGVALGSVNPIAGTIIDQIIKTHSQHLQTIQQAQAMQNSNGAGVPMTVGAQQAGVMSPQAAPAAQGTAVEPEGEPNEQ